MRKWGKIGLAVAATLAAFLLGAHAFIEVFLLSDQSETYMVKREVNVIRRMRSVDAADIRLDVRKRGRCQDLELALPEDKQYIDALVASVTRATVVDRGYLWMDRDAGDQITVWGGAPNGHRIGITLRGHFAPEQAPVVSAALRSDDLGKVVYSIFGAKGVKPRSGQPIPHKPCRHSHRYAAEHPDERQRSPEAKGVHVKRVVSRPGR